MKLGRRYYVTTEADNAFDGKSAYPLVSNYEQAIALMDSQSTKNRLLCLLEGITDLLHLGLQLYNSFASQHEDATGGLIPYPIQ